LTEFSKNFKSCLRRNLKNSVWDLQHGNPNETSLFILINVVQDLFESWVLKTMERREMLSLKSALLKLGKNFHFLHEFVESAQQIFYQ
jgi:hypothetical protein